MKFASVRALSLTAERFVVRLTRKLSGPGHGPLGTGIRNRDVDHDKAGAGGQDAPESRRPGCRGGSGGRDAGGLATASVTVAPAEK
jgi:hypothetical protein